MPVTLQDLRKAKFPTIKAFAVAYGRSAGVASAILRGRYHHTLTQDEVRKLATVLGVSFEACIDAADESYKQGYGADRIDMAYWRLRVRWEREDRWQEEVRNWKERGGSGADFRRIFEMVDASSVFPLLGLTGNPTRQQVMQAFRAKVKDMADGKGGYHGDMDELVQAKEQALAYLAGRRA